jgi:signal transduction histidine kinase
MKINYAQPYEVVLLRSNKASYPAMVHGRDAIIDDKQVRIVSVLDISDMKDKEKMLLHQSKMAQMGEMLSMIAHQWRQPLSAISATSGSINLKARFNDIDKDSIVQLTDNITKYSKHLSATINDFRDFFKENKEQKKISFSALVNSTLAIIETSIKNKNIDIVVNKIEDSTVYTYENELKQVILNLLKNAEDVLLDKKVANPIIEIDINKDSISIKDNGGGISKDIINKVFEPYFSTKTKKDGTGLGLYMSKTIIEEHCGGKLMVSNVQDGAKFTIKLSNIQKKNENN